MVRGKLCRVKQPTGFYVYSEMISQDVHRVMKGDELVLCLGESDGEFDRVMDVKGITGWLWSGYLEVVG